MTAPRGFAMPAPKPIVVITGIATCCSTDMRPALDWPGCKDRKEA
jgi:hypothetical protein